MFFAQQTHAAPQLKIKKSEIPYAHSRHALPHAAASILLCAAQVKAAFRPLRAIFARTLD
jgi:hypothetical protein